MFLLGFKIDIRHNTDLPLGEQSTTVRVFKGSEEAIGEGTAICSAREQFNRKRGFKVALGRALRNASLPKPQRAELWEAYLSKSYVKSRVEVEV